MLIYYNEEKFMPNDFGDKSIQKRSVIKKMKADVAEPHWFNAYIKRGELSDETAYLQWGQQTKHEY